MRNICKKCKYNNEQMADRMFFTNYCTMKECQTSGKYRCKYKVSREKLNIFTVINLTKMVVDLCHKYLKSTLFITI